MRCKTRSPFTEGELSKTRSNWSYSGEVIIVVLLEFLIELEPLL